MSGSKIRKSAQGEMCQVRIPGVCRHRDETTVLAHLNGAGMSIKHNDIHGAYCCFECHQAIDGAKSDFTRDDLRLMHYEGMVRTQQILIQKGLIKT